MENLLLRQGDSSINLGQRRPAALLRAHTLQSRPPARVVVRARWRARFFSGPVRHPELFRKKTVWQSKATQGQRSWKREGAAGSDAGAKPNNVLCLWICNRRHGAMFSRGKEIVALKPCRRCRREMSSPRQSTHAQGLKKRNQSMATTQRNELINAEEMDLRFEVSDQVSALVLLLQTWIKESERAQKNRWAATHK
jgi:hypothetical protein